MIVSEDTVSKALQYLAEDPHPIALAHVQLLEAENYLETLEAQFYLTTEGTVRERESQLALDPDVQRAKAAVAKAEGEKERHKARMNAADKLIETWRSENANIRAAERVR